ncbi:hypothetical protein FN846DRAFT_1009047, partial [Sphaerosporella brunnea]
EASHCNMLCSILRQILCQDESLFYHFQHEYERHKHLCREQQGQGQLKIPFESLKRIIRSVACYMTEKELYLIVDGIDESASQDRLDIINLLFSLRSNSYSKVKVLVASRPLPELTSVSGTPAYSRLALFDHPGMKRFTLELFQHNTLWSNMRQVTEAIRLKADGCFISTVLLKKQLLLFIEQGGHEHEYLEFLNNIPNGLEPLYRFMLSRVSLRIGLGLFELVMCAARPLTLFELQHALTIEVDSEERILSNEVFEESLITTSMVIDWGCGLLKIHTDAGKVEVVRTRHSTVLEFMLSDGKIKDSNAHMAMATVCIRYLAICSSYVMPRDGSPQVPMFWLGEQFESYARFLDKRPFINYVLRYSQDHVDQC